LNNKSIYLGLLGIVVTIGLIIALVSIVDNDEDTAEKTGKKSTENHQQVQHDSIDVFAKDDGSIEANNLFIPWTINKEGRTFYLSQRDGTVIAMDTDLGLVEVQDVELTEDVLHEGEGGFLGFTLAPDFKTSHMAFAYHTYEKDGETLNRIVSLVLQDGKWVERDVLVDNIPGGEINNGGRIQVGPDGMLYATTGDTGVGELAQDLNSLAGKILRINLDGSVPVDNPFKGSYVYSYGHRNSQGFTWDSEGNMYSSEHGEDGHDEINLIEAGKNYGWPYIQGDETADDMIAPIAHSGEETWAPSGMAYSDGLLYVASLAGKKIFTYDVESDEVQEFFADAGRLRDVLIDGDSLFTITNNHDSRGNPSEEDDRLIEVSITAKES
jgi:glucose/arabinose dehydrogenase